MNQEKLHWFLTEKDILELNETQISIKDKDLLHQFNRVLKFKEGELIVLFDGEGTYAKCEITELQKNVCVLNIINKDVKQRDESRLINLFFGIPKRNKFELILEKGAEVGVTSFNPIITDRTEKLNIKEDRAKRILIEASEQSENPVLPLLKKSSSFSKVILKLHPQNTFVFHTSGNQVDLGDIKTSGEVNLLIGPEGGWSQEEIDIFKDRGFGLYKIGDRILKTETASIVIPFLFSIK